VDRDERVGADAVPAARHPDGDIGGDVLALHVAVRVPRVHGDRLSAIPAPAMAG